MSSWLLEAGFQQKTLPYGGYDQKDLELAVHWDAHWLSDCGKDLLDLSPEVSVSLSSPQE
jgi:hypothetical protein